MTRKTACDGGGSIDPNGSTVCHPAAGTNSDGGSHIDPNGTNDDGGLQIDPNG
jgi:hypothetical protein